MKSDQTQKEPAPRPGTRKFSAFCPDYKRSPAYKKKLREKFIEKAKSYIGVPYAANYW